MPNKMYTKECQGGETAGWPHPKIPV